MIALQCGEVNEATLQQILCNFPLNNELYYLPAKSISSIFYAQLATF